MIRVGCRSIDELGVDQFGQRVCFALVAVPEQRRCGQVLQLGESCFECFVAEVVPGLLDLQDAGLDPGRLRLQLRFAYGVCLITPSSTWSATPVAFDDEPSVLPTA